MTEEERLRRAFLAQAQRQAPQFMQAPQNTQMSPAMNSQSAMSPENMALLRGQAAYDPGKRESILADQLRGGRDQVFAAGPQGKQMGNIFTAPTWSENLSGAVKKGLGGLEMARARKGMTEVDDLRGVAADATGQLGQIAEKERLTQQMTANDAVTARQGLAESVQAASSAMANRKQQHTEDRAVIEDDQWKQELDADAAADLADAQTAASDGTVKNLYRYIDPYTGDERMVGMHSSGKFWDPDNQKAYDKGQMEGYVREDAMSEGQREKAVQNFIEKNSDTMELMQDIESANETWKENGMEPGGNPFNWFTKQSGSLGDTFRLISDAGKEGSPTQDDFAAAKTVINTISRLRAGLSQTVSEIDRINEEVGSNIMVSPEVFMQYWDRLEGKVGEDIKRANRTASPRTMQAYMRWSGEKEAMGIPDDVGASSGKKSGSGQMSRGNKNQNKALEDYSTEEFSSLSPEKQKELLGL